MRQLVARLAKDESGATAIEYGLICALISVTIIGVLFAVGGNLGPRCRRSAMPSPMPAAELPAGGLCCGFRENS